MPLEEQEKKELEKRIMEQRRSVWKGEITPKRRTKKKQDLRKAKRLSDRQQENRKVEQVSEPQHQIIQDDSTEEKKETEQTLQSQKENETTEQILEQQLSNPKAKKKRRNVQSSVPSLRLALLVIIGLIAVIMIGVAIGYLAAVRGLIKI